jgi:hypothetical protein
MNDVINEKLGAVRDRVNALVLDGSLGSFTTAIQVKNHIQAQLDGKPDKRGTMEKHFRSFIERRNTDAPEDRINHPVELGEDRLHRAAS